jgi:hypothetical protein
MSSAEPSAELSSNSTRGFCCCKVCRSETLSATQITLYWKTSWTCTAHICWPIWLKFGTRGLHLIPLSHYAFRQNQFSENYTSLATVNETLPIFYSPHFPIWDEIRFRKCSQKFSVSHTLKISELKAVVYFWGHKPKIQSVLSKLLSNLGEIRCNRSAHNSVHLLWVKCKSAEGRPYLCMDIHDSSHILLCRETVWLLMIKKALVNYTYCLQRHLQFCISCLDVTASPVINSFHITCIFLNVQVQPATSRSQPFSVRWHAYSSVKYSAT